MRCDFLGCLAPLSEDSEEVKAEPRLDLRNLLRATGHRKRGSFERRIL